MPSLLYDDEETHLDEKDGREGHDNVDYRDTERHEGTHVWQSLGENIVAVVQD